MPEILEPVVLPTIINETKDKDTKEPRYNVICWNDPINLMTFVSHVFRKVFGWDQTRAEKHMREVHEKGKSILIQESAEKAEFYVHQLQSYKLQATMEKAE